MPMFTTFRIGLPVWPVQAPLRTCSENAAIRSSTSCTSARAYGDPSGARSATWSTARSSVTLMCSPANIASIRPRRPHSSARRTSSSTVVSVMRFFE